MTDPTPNPRPVMALRLMKELEAAGVLRVEDNIRRVVIDLTVGEMARIYVDRFADERVLAIIPSLDGVPIVREEPS